MRHSADERMTCAEARERLDDHLDGALGGAELRRLTAHLARCAGCAAELRFAGDVLGALRSLPEMECPPQVAERARRAAAAAPAALVTLPARLPAAGSAPAPIVPSPPTAAATPTAPAARNMRRRLLHRLPRPRVRVGAFAATAAAVAALALLALALSVSLWRHGGAGRPAGQGWSTASQAAPRPSAAELARGEAQARLALAYVARVSEHAGWSLRRDVLARRVVGPLAASVSRSLIAASGARREPPSAAVAAVKGD